MDPKKTVRKGKTEYLFKFFDVVSRSNEPEKFIFEEALRFAQKWIANYEKNPRSDWRQDNKISREQDIFNKTLGIMGEHIFLSCLDQLGIPSWYSRPKYPFGDPRKLQFDFALAGNFRIEIKTVAPVDTYKRVMVPGSQDPSKFDFLLAVKLYMDDNLGTITKKQLVEDGWDLQILNEVKLARLEGWLSSKQVVDCYNERFKNYQEFLDRLNPMNALWGKALRYSALENWREYGKIIAQVHGGD